MILECVSCHSLFESKRNRWLCAHCKLWKALRGYDRVAGGDMMGIGSYGGSKSGSKYPPLMKATDFKKPVTYTIATAEARDMKGETKLVIGFKGEERQLVVNKTNIGALTEKFGDVEPKELIGKEITLAAVPTTYQGQATKGIRVVG